MENKKVQIKREPWQPIHRFCGRTDTGICSANVEKGCKWPLCSKEYAIEREKDYR